VLQLLKFLVHTFSVRPQTPKHRKAWFCWFLSDCI